MQDDNQDFIGPALDAPVAEQRLESTVDRLEADAVVEVHNPLSKPFRVVYGRSVVAPPNETEAQRNQRLRMMQLGVNAQKDGSTMAHVQATVTIPAGATMKLPGNVATNAVRQMVTAILASQGRKNKIADMHARREIESQIVISVHTNTIDYMNKTPDTTQSDIERMNSAEATNGREEGGQTAQPKADGASNNRGTAKAGAETSR